MRPVDRGAQVRPTVPVTVGDGVLAGRGHDDRYRFAAPGAGLPETAPSRRLGGSRRASTPRPGWYAYRVTGSAELPSWAVEVALTIERPATSAAEIPAGSPADDGPGPTGPTGPRGRVRAAERDAGTESGEPRSVPPQSEVTGLWHSFGPEPGSRLEGGATEALLLLRTPGRMRWLEAIAGAVAAAIAEVEALAGVRSAAAAGELVEGRGGWRGPRLRIGPALPGLTPVTAEVVLAHLRMAGSRGLPAPLRRRRCGTGTIELAWRAGAGSVLTCDGRDGRSAQAVAALRGRGSAAAITPPPGGALVLRAWQARQRWGMACGLILGAPAAAGLGREAGRVAAMAQAEGWDAFVLAGSAAMHLARAGSPDLPAPEGPAQAAGRMQVAERFAACLAAAALEGRVAGVPGELAVTPWRTGSDALTTR
jgi:hypothetical protein